MTLQAADPRSLDVNPNRGWPVWSPLWRRFYKLNRYTASDSAGIFTARIPTLPPPK